MFGYTVVEPVSVLATHLTEVVRRHADEILTRDATKHLIDELKKTSPAVVDELIPGQMKLAEVQQILQMLLREQVPIRQLGPILETLGDYAARTKDPVLLTEYVRHRLARAISHALSRQAEPAARGRRSIRRSKIGFAPASSTPSAGCSIRMSPQAVEAICQLIGDGAREAGRRPTARRSCWSARRFAPALKQMTAAHLPRLVVLSYNEITRDTQIESVAW